jgi:hypothetical protein
VPIYEAVCHRCGKYQDYYQTAANCRVTPVCCGESAEKVILSAPMGIVDIPAYVSPVSGKLINSRKQRVEDLKETGSRPWEGMEQEQKEADRQKAYREAEEDKKLTVAAETALAQLAPEKRQVLEQAI